MCLPCKVGAGEVCGFAGVCRCAVEVVCSGFACACIPDVCVWVRWELCERCVFQVRVCYTARVCVYVAGVYMYVCVPCMKYV